METIKTAAFFVIEPLWRGVKDLADLLLYMTPMLVFCGIVYWAFS